MGLDFLVWGGLVLSFGVEGLGVRGLPVGLCYHLGGDNLSVLSALISWDIGVYRPPS